MWRSKRFRDYFRQPQRVLLSIKALNTAFKNSPGDLASAFQQEQANNDKRLRRLSYFDV